MGTIIPYIMDKKKFQTTNHINIYIYIYIYWLWIQLISPNKNMV